MDPDLAATVPLIPDLALEELESTRRTVNKLAATAAVDSSGVDIENRMIPGSTGAPLVPVRIFRPQHESNGPRPGVLDIHGGGFVMGSVDLDDAANVDISREVGAVVVSVDYRLAPEHPFPSPAEDCYAALLWLALHATELGVDPGRLAILGDSAGGGLAATVALFARDRSGPALAMQALLEPELDDRLQTHSMRNGTDTVGWRHSQAVLSWRYYLGDHAGAPPLHAAPARTDDVSGLPWTYITVNELDCLRDEGLDYARKLLDAGVSTELHCWPGTFHGFQFFAATAPATWRASAALHDALRRGLGCASEADVIIQAARARRQEAMRNGTF